MLVSIKLEGLKNGAKLFSQRRRNSISTVQMAFRSTGTQKKKKKKKFPEENYSTWNSGGGSLMIWTAFSSSGKLKLQFVSGRLKADYVKMLNNLSLAQVEKNGFFSKIMLLLSTMHQLQRCTCLNKKIKLLDHPACYPDPISIEHLWGLIVVKVYEGR